MNKINTEELINSHSRQPYNKLQDMFPFNSTEAGLNGVYVASDEGKSFYINTPCIVTSNKTITKETNYVLDLETNDHHIKEFNAKVLDAFFTDGSVYILIQDLLTNKKRIISQFLDRPLDKCPWFLFDLEYLHKTLKSKNNHGDMLVGDKELLEFNF